MKTKFATVEEILAKPEINCPLNLSTIPNTMGINLCSVEGVSWTRQDDEQLVSLTIHFVPSCKLAQLKRLQNERTELLRAITINPNDTTCSEKLETITKEIDTMLSGVLS